MPLAHLIFFPEPRELTDEQIEEARALGHLREPSRPDGDSVPYPVTRVPDQKQPPPAPAVKPPAGAQPASKPEEKP